MKLYSTLENLRTVFENVSSYQQEQLQGLTLAFLFRCKELFEQFQKAQKPRTRQQDLYQRYLHLVNRFFIEYRSIEEYAAILNITPNHLSSVVKSISGKSPKSFLDESMISESKNLLAYTSSNVSEIAYKLGFSEPTHFIRFFKKVAGVTPTEYRLNRPMQAS